MIHTILRIIEVVAVLGCFSSSIYYLLCLWSAVAFTRECTRAENLRSQQEWPPVSILKPLRGADPGMSESFRSHCLQDYPEYELIFGVHEADDPAIESVLRLQSEFPDLRIQLVVCPQTLGANVKVSNLIQMLAGARYEHLIVNDSDIRVEADYLRRVIPALTEPQIGLITCLYRGIAAGSLGSLLEALGISTDFCAGVLAARQLEGIRFGLGSTLAFRRADLEKIGGFAAVADYLADDYELGKRISDLGMKVRLSDVVVDTILPAYPLRDFLAHQLRWVRGVRDSRPGGYFGLISTFGLAWALLVLMASRGELWAWGVLGIILFLRIAEALIVGLIALGDRQVLKYCWLIPVRDVIAVFIWMAGSFGKTVIWRGNRFCLKNGKLIRMAQ